jgi:hypothetical protein
MCERRKRVELAAAEQLALGFDPKSVGKSAHAHIGKAKNVPVSFVTGTFCLR